MPVAVAAGIGAAAAVAGGVAAAAAKKKVDESQGGDKPGDSPVDSPRMDVGEPLETRPAPDTTLAQTTTVPAESAEPVVVDVDTYEAVTGTTVHADEPRTDEHPGRNDPLGGTPPPQR